MIGQIVLSSIAVLAGIYFFTRQSFRKRYDLHRMPGPPGLPLLGNLLQIMGQKSLSWHKLYADWVTAYGSIFVWYMSSHVPVVVLSDPEDWYKLLSGNNTQPLPKWSTIYAVLDADAPKHYSMLTTPDTEYWRRIRKTINEAFSPAAMRKAWPVVLARVQAAVVSLEKLAAQTGVTDVDEAMSRLTADIIGEAGFSTKMGALEVVQQQDGGYKFVPNAYLQGIKAAFEEATKLATNPVKAALLVLLRGQVGKDRLSPDAKKGSHFDVTNLLGCLVGTSANSANPRHEQEESLMKVVKDRGPQPEDNTELWACASRLKEKSGAPMNDGDLAANLNLLFAAGFETTSNAISFTLFELAHHPQAQAALAAELDAAELLVTPSRPQPRRLELSDLTKLTYLNALFKETQRLHPTAPLGTNRQLDRDMTIRGYRLPKGTVIIFAPITLHRSPDNWLRPDEFLPDRFMPQQAEEKVDPRHPDATLAGNKRDLTNSWSPFTLGPRNCVGQALALMEARAAVAMLAASFEFAPEVSMKGKREQWLSTEQVFRITLQPKTGLPLQLRPRRLSSTPPPMDTSEVDST